ncbi:MAG TPA: hypothetical protein VGN17_14980 [Bryobacteraceae bacterium]|jgi:hypothetical protein
MRTLIRSLAMIAVIAAAQATTLQQLSLDNIISQSTAAVHAKVTGSRVALRGQDIWTFYQLQVMDTLKTGPNSGQIMEVAVPGGAMQGVRQAVAGAPALTPGGEYVLFLWTSKSGLTQVIGLSQGLFLVNTDASGNKLLSRPAAAATMLDQNGNPVTDQAVSLSLSGLRLRMGVPSLASGTQGAAK